jgi:RNA polymerase sigma-70 factor (ECF subfamily)
MGHPNLSSEQWDRLLNEARGGDVDARNQMWEQLRSYLMLVADQTLNGNLSRKLDASDVVQSTMLQAEKGFDTFEGNVEALRAWLRRITENNCHDKWRKFSQTAKRDVSREVELSPLLADGERDVSASKVLQRKESDTQLVEAIRSLSATKQRLIELRHRQGFSYAEIAERMDMTEVAARKMWSRTIEELRNKLA